MRQCTAAKVKPIPRNERKSVVNLFTGISTEIPSAIILPAKRSLENAEKPQSKRQVLESLQPTELPDDIAAAKEEFARILDECMNNNSEAEIDKSNAFVIADEEITKGLRSRERLMRSRDTVLCAPKNDLNVPIDHIRELLNGKPSSRNTNPSSRGSQSRRSEPSSSSSRKSSSSKRTGTPIIVVPKSGTSVLTIDNAVEFLQDGKLNLTHVAKRRSGNTNVVSFKYKVGEKTCSFELMDSIIKLPKNDYGRIAGVFANGTAWQFTGPEWQKYEPKVAKLFQKVKGFYLCSDDKPVPESIANLDIKVLQVCFTKPYTVQRAQIYFWDEFNQHLIKQEFI